MVVRRVSINVVVWMGYIVELWVSMSVGVGWYVSVDGCSMMV